MAAAKGVFDQLLRPLCPDDASVELVDLAFGEPAPARAAARVCGQQLPDLLEREPRVLAKANESDVFGARRRVLPSPAGALGGREPIRS
jgi:hypothetical protein